MIQLPLEILHYRFLENYQHVEMVLLSIERQQVISCGEVSLLSSSKQPAKCP
jgi:hypothetical protein